VFVWKCVFPATALGQFRDRKRKKLLHDSNMLNFGDRLTASPPWC